MVRFPGRVATTENFDLDLRYFSFFFFLLSPFVSPKFLWSQLGSIAFDLNSIAFDCVLLGVNLKYVPFAS